MAKGKSTTTPIQGNNKRTEEKKKIDGKDDEKKEEILTLQSLTVVELFTEMFQKHEQ